ncbi:response regulator [Erythrobacter sp.]|uniref:response regulator n=1 Tax=Erythrobacter sp. TaxID=1042 RepID=UPI001B2DF62F|nr:response regulator [Erythrobacter sp.]MBO6527533.1 response regulator [Erythrobacter sp.]MBO6530213.1 response regulator [Erythrobacter sp.]
MPKTVLVVEDEPLLIMELIDLFEDAGYSTLDASNADQAFKIMENRKDQIDLLVTDIRLGQGPDGWDVARRSRQLVGELPIIFVSADAASEWEEQNILNSVMLAKPVQGRDLLEAVATR